MEDIRDEILTLIKFLEENRVLKVEIITEIINHNNTYSFTLKKDIYLISEKGEKYKFNFNLIGE